jgi:PhnB protein
MFTVNPYLSFNGNAEQAMRHYAAIFGGELSISRFANLPPSEDYAVLSDEDKQKVLHAVLPIGNATLLMASDMLESQGQKATPGGQVAISLNPDNETEAQRLFEALAEDSNIICPFGPMFWGAMFGMCTDRFGITWMVNYELRKA